MAKIKKLTFQQACKMTGYDPVNCLPWPNPTDEGQEAYNALKRLEIYIEAYNMQGKKKWIADYSNRNQAKWRIWFIWDASAAAFRFLHTHFDYTSAGANTGSRQAIRTEELADHIGQAHIDDWNKWLVKQ